MHPRIPGGREAGGRTALTAAAYRSKVLEPVKSPHSILMFVLVAIVAMMVIASPVVAMTQIAPSCEACGEAVAMPDGCCEPAPPDSVPAQSDADDDGCCSACYVCHGVPVAMQPPVLVQAFVDDLPSGFVTHHLAWRSVEAGIDLFRPPCL